MFILDRKYHRYLNLGVFVFTFICLLCFFFLIPGNVREYINGDYTPQVNSLFSGRYFLNAGDHVIDRHPPLTALTFFLVTKAASLVHLNPVYTYMFFVVIVVSFTNVLLYNISVVFGNKPVSLITAVLFASCPFVGVLPLKLISEPMFIFFYFVALYYLIKQYRDQDYSWVQYIKIGAALGLCMLSRPIGLSFALFFIAFIFLVFKTSLYRKLLFSFLIGISAFIIVLPWELKVYKHNNVIVPLSSAGVYASRDGMSFNKKSYRQKLDFPEDVNKMLGRFYKNYEGFRSSSQVHDFIIEEFKRSPTTVLKLYAIKASRFWYGVESQNSRYELFNKILMSFYLLLCGVGLYTAIKKRYDLKAVTFFSIFILMNWATAVMFLPLLRYLVPVIGILFIFAAFGVWKVLTYFKVLSDDSEEIVLFPVVKK